jgi:hypothetical protein
MANLSTRHSEKKIDQIGDRLSRIEQLLHNIDISQSQGVDAQSALQAFGGVIDSTQAAHRLRSSPSTGLSHPSNGYDHEGEDLESDALFEDNPSFGAHTAFASHFIDETIERDAAPECRQEIDADIAILRQIMELGRHQSWSREVRFDHRDFTAQSNNRNLPVPPLNIVVDLLQKITGIAASISTYTHVRPGTN